jgi:hypothetical protein
MKAVAYRTPGPIDREDALQDITLERPQAEGRDLLVKINAVSVNPVDTKLRLGAEPEGGDRRVLGFDASDTNQPIGVPTCRTTLKQISRMPFAQKAELDRRLAAYEADGNRGRLATESIADIRRKL